MKTLKIGTRGSKLALVQTQLVIDSLLKINPDLDYEIVILKTRGDKILDKSLKELGDRGVFVKEFEQAILDNRIDIAVHSAKDLPIKLADGLDIVSVLPRADVRDVLIERFPYSNGFIELKENAVVGTCSVRREFYAKKIRSDLQFKLIRGNIDTRLSKLKDGMYDAIILAKAGLDRLGLIEKNKEDFNFIILETYEFLPAACQGIIAIEAKKNSEYSELLNKINDKDTYLQYSVEHKILELLQADCSQPIAAYAEFVENGINISVMYAGRELRVFSSKEDVFSAVENIVNDLRG